MPGSEFLAPIHQISDSDEHFYLVYSVEDAMAPHPITKMNDLENLEEKDVQTIVYQLVSALEFLDTQYSSVIGNLKPNNVIV